MFQIRNLQKVIDGKTVIDIPALDIMPGQITGVLARPGSGAETLISLLTGRLQPSAGSLRLSNLDPYGERTALSSILGVMFTDDALYKNMGTFANLRFQARLHGLPRERAESILTQIGLADAARLPAGKLSPSLQRRLAFGRAILHAPKCILLIEPFARCDEATVNLLTSQIQLLADGGAAIVVVSADSTWLTPVCDTIYELQDGHMVEVIRSPAETAMHQPFRIPVRVEDKVLLINPADVLYADAGQGKAYLITSEGRYSTQYTMAELERKLKRSGFFRAHRAYLVNLQHVREVIPFTRSTFNLGLDDPTGTKIPLSKSAAAELKELLGY